MLEDPHSALIDDPQERERLDELASFLIAGTGPESRFDSIAGTASDIFNVPMAFLTLIDKDVQWYKAAVGRDVVKIPRSLSFCNYTIAADDVLVIGDAASDPRFSKNPTVTGPPYIRFYAGAPLISKNGKRLGALSIEDTEPNLAFTAAQCQALKHLAALAMEQIELRKEAMKLSEIASLSSSIGKPLMAMDRLGFIRFANDTAHSFFGFAPGTLLGHPMDSLLTSPRTHANAETLSVAFEDCVPGTTRSFDRIAHRLDQTHLPVSIVISRWGGSTSSGISVIIDEPSGSGPLAARPEGLAADLPYAITSGAFELHYQPQVDLRTGLVTGAEALVRWRHPRRGLLQPSEFLQILEDSPYAMNAGWWILDEACRQLAKWRDLGFPEIRMAVNLFSIQFSSTSMVTRVCETLTRHMIAPELLELEVTETIDLLNDCGVASLRVLRDMGIGIAFDDFGTGYASLSSLQRFPLSTLKLDRSFVSNVLTSERDATIVRSLIAMANALGLETVAEGVETPGQAEFLESLKCSSAQGYLYGKPMPAQEFEALILASGKQTTRSAPSLGAVA